MMDAKKCTGLESLKLQPLPQCKVAHRRRFTDGISTGVGFPIHTRGWRLETVSGRQPASASYKTPVSLSLGGNWTFHFVNTIKYNINCTSNMNYIFISSGSSSLAVVFVSLSTLSSGLLPLSFLSKLTEKGKF
jgi:hypothetical protein